MKTSVPIEWMKVQKCYMNEFPNKYNTDFEACFD